MRCVWNSTLFATKIARSFFCIDHSVSIYMCDLFHVYIITETSDFEGKKRSASIDSKLGRGTQLKGNCSFCRVQYLSKWLSVNDTVQAKHVSVGQSSAKPTIKTHFAHARDISLASHWLVVSLSNSD